MAITRPSINLTEKQNIRAVGNRLNEATAEDYIEIANILNQIIDAVELMTGANTTNTFYGVFTSLGLLQNQYPTAPAGSFANIDSGSGNNVQLALWDDDDNIWVLQQTTTTSTSKTYGVGDDVTNIEVTDVNGDYHIIVSGTYEGPDKDKLESYSANSISRAL
ncbi:hypothetical protein SAMN05192545_2903 [Maribacter dokdonensis]|uniref:Uncharacterized protein n=1 Tax=Maribacter dokdonensis TaxID=320912 RepID=A0ABY0UT93_9FLAO|nr:hypothetical protein [Maribacter dokdonensis]SDT15910.1 hypothetical protein SAMN05192545_2903 [Maribacter dokdonensis]